MILRSSATTKVNPQEEYEEIGKRRDTPIREPNSELEPGMKTPREAQWSFTESSTPGRRDQTEIEVDPSMITTFLKTCMKLLCDSKAVQGL